MGLPFKMVRAGYGGCSSSCGGVYCIQCDYLPSHLFHSYTVGKKFVVLLAYVVVGDAEYQAVSLGALDGEHAVVEEQTHEHLRLGQHPCWERLLDVAHDFSRFRDGHDDPLAVTVQFVKLEQTLHLVVVRLGVRVQHLLGCFACAHVVAQIVEHHVAVEYPALCLQGFLGEAVIVVPGFHLSDHGFDVAVRWNLAVLLVVGEEFAHVLGGESEHLVEFLFGGDVPSDVESACHVVEGDGTDSGDEDAFERSLELLEDVAVEAFGVCDGPVHLFTLLVEDGVGEVVILVYDEVEGVTLGFCFTLYDAEFSSGIVRGIHLLLGFFRIELTVVTDESIQGYAQIEVEILFKLFDGSAYLREVKVQYLVAALEWGGMLADPQGPEPLLELVLGPAVVVGVKHAQEHALAEAARTDEKQASRLVLRLPVSAMHRAFAMRGNNKKSSIPGMG